MSTPDVVIVGAGPAGSIAALQLARAGVRVRLLDRASFPRDKLCGDTLNPGALGLLAALGIGDEIRRCALRIKGMIVTGPRNTRVVGDYGPGVHGAAIVRRQLDEMLVRAAIRAGVELEEGVVVRAPVLNGRRVVGVRAAAVRMGRLRPAPTRGGEHDVHARLVLAADGRHSRLAFGLGLSRFAARPRRWAFGAYFAGVRGMTEYGEMHVRADGYIGVAPVPDGLVNVCVVREWRPGAARRLHGDVVADAVTGDDALRDRFHHAVHVGATSILGPLAVESQSAGIPGLLLAGDAAGFIDPITGDGLRFAIRGAQLAAEAALRELQSGVPAHHDLSIARRREFGRKWRVNRTLRVLVGSPSGVRLASAMASRWCAPLRALIAIAGDVGPP